MQDKCICCRGIEKSISRGPSSTATCHRVCLSELAALPRQSCSSEYSPDLKSPCVFSDIHVPHKASREITLPLSSQIDGETGEILTYAALKEAVSRVASGLSRYGFREGDVMMMYMSNRPEYVIMFHAVLSLRGSISMANPQYRVGEWVRFPFSQSFPEYFLSYVSFQRN